MKILSIKTLIGMNFALSIRKLKIHMKISKKHLIPRLALAALGLCAMMLVFAPNAKAVSNLAFNDQYNVGQFKFTPGNPADPSSVRSYVNYMITLSPGASGVFSGMTFFRSNNVFANLPNATGGVSLGNVTTINLGAGGVYTYLFAKYDGQNDYSQVWYIGNLSGTITIPADGPLGHGLSDVILFGPGAGTGVPDGGTTVMLLGAALGALGMVRRKLKI
jgi:hypothetical protein